MHVITDFMNVLRTFGSLYWTPCTANLVRHARQEIVR